MFSDLENIDKYIIQLQFLFMISGINTVYFQYNKLLYDILMALKKQLNLDLYHFGSDEFNIEIQLSNNIIKNKCNALRLITGYNKTLDKVMKPIETEKIYKVGE